MSDLKIDVGEVLASASSAERIAGDFSAAERIADETAGYTGHDGLAGKVRDFGDKWDIARGKLEDNLTFIADYLRAVVDTFEDLDTDLAASLQQAAAGDQTAATNLNDEIGKSTAPAAPAAPAPTPSPSPGPSPTPPAGGDR
ncbi:hypothetical protein E5344_11400 [Microbacterium laevaniformans]|uniref:WXG100 family type VII secretion target n=1 Tax=Microbacterium laevaniformans TaxID=36807 RepID=A0A4S2D5H0_9MICO|nr:MULTISPECIES: hypothetical protein [Microbacterium]AXA95346.1 hypothetical protein CEP17_02300 [Microbacterium sp. PM5]MDC7805028.1 hypothetical protein [Sphingomonas sp. BLCC-B65]TGY35604.1 hypothetical protein E5344_11400 [Microbacterium laevaniformans]